MKFIKEIVKELFVKKNLAIATVAVSFVMLLGFGFNALMDNAYADDYGNPKCTPRADVDRSNIQIQGNTAKAWVKNNSEKNCTYDLTLASYEVHATLDTEHPKDDPDFLSTQVLFDSETVTLAPGEWTWIEINLPQCAYQADLFFGSFAPSPPDGSDPHKLLKWALDLDRPLCGPQCPANFDDPVLTSPTEVKGLKNGDTVNYNITFSGDGDVSVADVTGLPWWLKWDGGTKVSGKIPADTGSNRQVSFTVHLIGEIDGLQCGESSTKVTLFWDKPAPECPANFNPIVINGANNISSTPGGSINYQFTVSHGSQTSVDTTVSNLPSWLSFNPSTNRITGTVPANFSGSRTFTITSVGTHNPTGLVCGQDTKTVTINVIPPQCPAGFVAPNITSPTTVPNKKSGDFINYQIAFTPGSAQTVVTSVSGLPSWLSFNASTNRVTGTIPNQPSSGQATFTVTAAGFANGKNCASDTIQVTVTWEAQPNQCPSNFAGPTITGTSVLNVNPGDAINYQFSVSGSGQINTNVLSLPSWLSFNPSTKRVTGTVPTNFTGTEDFTISSIGVDVGTGLICGEATKKVTINVVPEQCPLDPPVLPESRTVQAEINKPFSFTIPLTSGDAPITYSIQSGTLPPGLTLSGNKIVGTPTRAVTRDVVIKAENECGFDTMNLRIEVKIPECPIDPPVLGEDREFNLKKGVSFNFTIPVVGGAAIDSFHIIRGSLPNGLTLSGGVISGTPTVTGEFMVEIQAENECGADSIELRFDISEEESQCPDLQPPNVTSGSNFKIKAGQGFDYLITFTGDDDIEIKVENLPSWLSFNSNTNRVSGTVPSNSNFSFTVKLRQTADGEFCAEDVHVVNLSPDDGPTGRCINCDDDDEPRVLVASNRFTPPSGEVMGVTLTQIPITGVGGTLQSIIFTIGLLIISAGLAYLIMSRSMREKIVSIFSFGGQRYAVADDRISGGYAEHSRDDSDNNDNDIGGYASAAYAPTHPLTGGFGGAIAAVDAERQQRVEDRFSELTGRKNITRQEDDPFSDRIAKEIGALARRESKREAAVLEAAQGIDEMDTSALEARIEEEARVHKVLISDDGVKTLVRTSSANENNALSILSELIKVSEEWYAREDGWLLLNQKRIKEVLFATYVMMVPTFFSWIAEGNEERMFGFIKMLQTQGHSAKEFIKNAVYELDALYRYRTEGQDSDVSNETIKVAGRWSLSTIEKMIESLIGAVDGSYSNDFTPIKLALLRAVSIAKKEGRD